MLSQMIADLRIGRCNKHLVHDCKELMNYFAVDVIRFAR